MSLHYWPAPFQAGGQTSIIHYCPSIHASAPDPIPYGLPLPRFIVVSVSSRLPLRRVSPRRLAVHRQVIRSFLTVAKRKAATPSQGVDTDRGAPKKRDFKVGGPSRIPRNTRNARPQFVKSLRPPPRTSRAHEERRSVHLLRGRIRCRPLPPPFSHPTLLHTSLARPRGTFLSVRKVASGAPWNERRRW